MRTLLAVASLLALSFTGTTEVRAYGDGPWCAIVPVGAGVVSEMCDMPSFEVCRQEALGFGSSSFCRQNSRYPGYWKRDAGPERRKARRHPRRK